MTTHFQDPEDTPAVKPYIEWIAKITLTDSRSVNNDTYPAYLEWTFTFQLRDRCADDTITLDTEIDSFNYTIASGALPSTGDFRMAYTQLYGGTPYDCDIEATLEYLDSDLVYDWVDDTALSTLAWISSFDTDIGAFVVDTSDRATYGIETQWSLKITLSLPDSIMDDDDISITD